MNICRRKHLFRKRRSAHLLLPRECTCAVETQFCINKCIVAAGKIGWSFCSDSKINLRQHNCLSILQWERSVAERKKKERRKKGKFRSQRRSVRRETCIQIIQSLLILFSNLIHQETLSIEEQVTSLCRSSYFHTRKIASFRPNLSGASTVQLVSSLILARLDYCNSTLSRRPSSLLSRQQNVTAMLLDLSSAIWPRYSPSGEKIYWLPF